MIKITALIFLCFLIVAGVVYYFKIPTPFNNLLIKSENLALEEVKGEKTNFIPEVFNNLTEAVKTSVSNVKENIYQNSQDTLNSVFDKDAKSPIPSSDVSVLVTNEISESPEQNVSLDLSLKEGFKLNLQIGKQYFITFKNTLSGNCLFINDKKYELVDGLILKVSFPQKGVYKVKTSPCQTLEKDIGELIVD